MAIRDAMNLEDNAILLLIGDYLTENNFEAIQKTIKDFHPADIAFLLNLLEDSDVLRILSEFPDKVQAEIIAELNESKQEYIVQALDRPRLTEIIQNLESDDAADLMGTLDQKSQEQILREVDKEDAEELRELLQHGEDTAGGIMSKEVVSLEKDATVEQAIQEIRKAALDTEQIYNIFVISKKDKTLLGVLPLNKLVLSKPETRVSEIMNDVTSVAASLDQEDVAQIVKKYDLVEIPVVNDSNQLIGRITHDDIIDVIEEEAEEDIAKLSGTSEEAYEHSALDISKKRISWLLVGLLGGLFSAVIISRFEVALSKVLLLAFFVPVIMAMGGIVGIQSSTITVRALALGEFHSGFFNKRVIRELFVGLINGCICSLLLAVLIFVWQRDIYLSSVVGGAMFCVMMMSSFSGTFIPLFLNKFNVDPGIATGPFVTTLNDVIGLLVYFGLATLLMVL